jgi:Ca2+:H+ antiporter
VKLGRLDVTPLDALLVFVPIAIALELAHAGAVWIFISACLAIIPLAGWMGKATEHLAAHFGAGIGGLLNATFGNAAELIIALFALRRGLHDLVKASLAGSIIGNVLLVLGLSMLVGGFRHSRQTFNRTAAGLGSSLLALSAVGLIAPAIFHAIATADHPAGQERDLSLDISIVLAIAYVLSLVFSLRTHRHLFASTQHESVLVRWSRRRAVIVLAVATALVALMSEFLVGAVDATAARLGMSEVFVGVIVVAIIGNAAEHSTAVIMAYRNQMDLAINIAIGSGIQIALFAAPLLVFASYAIGPGPMDLVFTPFEVVAVVLSVLIVGLVSHDGESHWMEGVMLLAVYVIAAMVFYFL